MSKTKWTTFILGLALLWGTGFATAAEKTVYDAKWNARRIEEITKEVLTYYFGLKDSEEIVTGTAQELIGGTANAD